MKHYVEREGSALRVDTARCNIISTVQPMYCHERGKPISLSRD